MTKRSKRRIQLKGTKINRTAELEEGSKIRFYDYDEDLKKIEFTGTISKISGDDNNFLSVDADGCSHVIPKELVIQEVMELDPPTPLDMPDLNTFTREYLD